jgi:hypothetical protein
MEKNGIGEEWTVHTTKKPDDECEIEWVVIEDVNDSGSILDGVCAECAIII